MPEASIAEGQTDRPSERRRVPRIPFKANSVVAETNSMRIVAAQTTELSRFGCFVKTLKPLPQGSKMQIDVADGGNIFTASGRVAYVTGDRMGIVFGTVESDSYEILSKWLARIPRRSDRYSFAATIQVKELNSWRQGLVTRDLSAGGCFIRSAHPLSAGTRIHLRIEHGGDEFTATARVTDNVSSEGMGVEFIEVNDRAILEKWLTEKLLIDEKPVW